jgi:exosortase family protein XrtF
MFISAYDTKAQPELDPITRAVTYNCAQLASFIGYSCTIVEDDHLNKSTDSEQTYDSLYLNEAYAISVEEGCNGINIMILFMAFVVGFGGRLKAVLVFIPVGLFFIHAANILRLLLLALLNVELGGRAFHFFHKYFFTAVIYLAVLFLWYLWVRRFSGKLNKKSSKVEAHVG